MSKISMDPQQERYAVEQAKKDPAKFSIIYDHYYPHIYRFFAVKLTNPGVIEDLTSMTFEKALKSIEKFTWKGFSYSAWLYKIAHNSLIDYYRSQGKKAFDPIPEHFQVSSGLKTPEQEAEISFNVDLIKNQLESLDPTQRKIIYMKFFDGYNNKIIADKLNLTETNVSTIVYRVIKTLRKANSN